MTGVRGLQSSTIQAYFSGFRMLHLLSGHHSPCLRSDIVRQLLQGATNLERTRAFLHGKKRRIAVTFDLLYKLKLSLLTSHLDIRHRRLIWFTATCAFMGSFRIHEILPRLKGSTDTTTLLHKDTSLSSISIDGQDTQVLTIHLKNPKEDKLQHGVKVDLFEITGSSSWMCPIHAYRSLICDINPLNPHSPVATLPDGAHYTGSDFNTNLKALLAPYVDYSLHPVLSHSFRAGLATAMSKAGFSDDLIRQTGRWRSNAFLCYIKTARTSRALMAKDLITRIQSTFSLP